MERKFSAFNLIKQHVLILWAKKLVFHILRSHLFQNAERWLWNRSPASNYTSSSLAPVSENLTGSVSNQIFCFIPSNCNNLEVNINSMVTAHFNRIKISTSTYIFEWPHKHSMQQVYMYTHSFQNIQTTYPVSWRIPPCWENEIAINIEFELNAISLKVLLNCGIIESCPLGKFCHSAETAELCVHTRPNRAFPTAITVSWFCTQF